MPAVIGIDPSLTATGIAYPYGRLETVTYAKGCTGDARLCAICDQVADAVDNIAPGDLPTAFAVVEDLPTHAHGAGLTGMTQGVIRVVLIESLIAYATVPPAVLKKFATGSGNATKSDMRMAWFKRTGTDVRDDNQVDAAWLREMGLHHLGAPTFSLPAAQTDILNKITWPIGDPINGAA